MLRWLVLLCLLSAPALAQEIDAEVYVAIQGATEAEATGDLSKARQLLEAALRPDWRGGRCARVVEGGHVRLGDRIVRMPEGPRGW
mgnify:CR=1 FL=1